MKKAMFTVLALANLAGCGTTSGLLNPLPEIPERASAGTVVVVRVSSFVGAANGYTVAFDGKDLFGIGSGEYAEFRVPAGVHYLGVKCFGGFTPTWKEDSLKFEAKSSDTNYFVVSPNLSCAAVRPASRDEALKLVPGSKQVALDKQAAK